MTVPCKSHILWYQISLIFIAQSATVAGRKSAVVHHVQLTCMVITDVLVLKDARLAQAHVGARTVVTIMELKHLHQQEKETHIVQKRNRVYENGG